MPAERTTSSVSLKSPQSSHERSHPSQYARQRQISLGKMRKAASLAFGLKIGRLDEHFAAPGDAAGAGVFGRDCLFAGGIECNRARMNTGIGIRICVIGRKDSARIARRDANRAAEFVNRIVEAVDRRDPELDR